MRWILDAVLAALVLAALLGGWLLMRRTARRAQAQQQAVEAATQRRLEALAQVTLALSQQLDPDRLLQQITDALATLTGAQNVVLWEVDRAAGLLVRRAWTTDPAIGAMDLPTSLTMEQGGTGWIARHREPLFVEDIAVDARIMAAQWALSRDLVAFGGVPVAAGEELLGVLTLNLKRGRLPQGGDRTLLPSFAAQAAVAIRNARLFADNTRLYDEARQAIEAIVGQGARMAKIIQSLLLFSRQRKPERRPVDLRDVIPQILNLRETQLAVSGIRVETAFGADVPRAEGDAHQLQQVVLNLILNAEQAILGSGVGGRRTGDHIRITTSARRMADATRVIVQVADNGPGIPAAVLPRVFEPFFTTKKVGEGAGLGLSVSYGIVEQHGGRLSVESEPGRTVFTLELPAAPSGDREAGTAGEPADGAGRAAALGRGRRVLVVDDEPDIVELVTSVLDDQGWHVDVASGGRAALERLQQTRYDLVLSDVRMPEGDGADFYRAAVAQQTQLAQRFLFMTGDTANEDAWRVLQSTRAPVLSKPFTPQALLHAVERVSA